jgi:hypothetical protein
MEFNCEFAAGWPLRSLMYEAEYHWTGPQTGDFVIRGGIELPARPLTSAASPHIRAIPLTLIPLGFAVNTLVYALIAAFIWHAAVTLRREHRQARRQCPECGYSRIGLDSEARCPECGSPVR